MCGVAPSSVFGHRLRYVLPRSGSPTNEHAGARVSRRAPRTGALIAVTLYASLMHNRKRGRGHNLGYVKTVEGVAPASGSAPHGPRDLVAV